MTEEERMTGANRHLLLFTSALHSNRLLNLVKKRHSHNERSLSHYLNQAMMYIWVVILHSITKHTSERDTH